MKTIFWKEVRENLKWAAIAFAALSLALAVGWSSVSDPNSNESYLSVLSSAVVMATTLCSAAFGAALGFLQILPEQRRDRWAFLVHRPVPWTTIFWGKVAAGLSLYFTAMLIPWLFLCWWASLPGHVAAPFDWRMSLSGLADILSGCAFYFAGMITSLRQARWLGSKAFALLGAIWTMGAATGAVHFWGACGWIACMTALLALSARGNFMRNGVYTSQPAVARWSLIVVFLLGLCMLFAGTAEFSEHITDGGYQYGNRVEYAVSKEGNPIKAYSDGGRITRVDDADGHDLQIKPEILANYFNNAPRVQNLTRPGTSMYQPMYGNYDSYIATASEGQGTIWFYFRASRQLQAYDHDTRRLTGYLAPDGYHATADGVPASTFPSEFQEGNYGFYYFEPVTIFGSKVYLTDFAALKVQLLADAGNEADLKGAALLSADAYYGAPVADGFVAVGLKDGITFFKGADGSRQCVVPYEEPYVKESATWSLIRVAMTPDKQHFLVWYQIPPEKIFEVGFKPGYFYRYSIDGALEKKWTLPPLFQAGRPPSWTEHLWAIGSSMASQLYFAGDAWLGKQMGDPRQAFVWNNDIVRNWGYLQLNWLVSMITGIVCAVAAVARGRAYRLSVAEVGCWTVVVLLCGIAGLAVFIAIKEWPARVNCASCSQKRTVELDSCEHCGAGWKKPEPDGTEIFA
ncbi:MAG TPA: hypothetical protein VG733_05880 [Chthoniobacteraceae bacterium]|nr:hypothetical protein [Chthoniobacteraceae bacterium]